MIGETMQELVNKELELEMGAYIKRDFVVTKGEGVFLYDLDNNKYLDCVAGHGAGNVGHCHPLVVRAVTEQLNKIIVCPETFPNDTRIKALEKLQEITGLKKFFLCNSGAESVEGAMKLARINTKKTGFIVAMNAFHGRTMGALSLTFKPKYREPYAPLIDPVKRVRFGDSNAIKEAIDKDTAAVVLECIQGEAGVRLPPEGYLKQVKEICDEKDVLLIIDEVQTGFGRTGKMFSYEHFDVKPDIQCMAKSIAGGLAMGAVGAREDLVFPPLMHGSTFGGNPVACAGLIATVDAIKSDKMLENAASNGRYFLERLKEFETSKKQVREARGLGLMLALELKIPAKEVMQKLFENKILTLPGGLQVVRFLPPLSINKEQIDGIIEVLERVLE